MKSTAKNVANSIIEETMNSRNGHYFYMGVLSNICAWQDGVAIFGQVF
jgi:hypothetical protein